MAFRQWEQWSAIQFRETSRSFLREIEPKRGLRPNGAKPNLLPSYLPLSTAARSRNLAHTTAPVCSE